MGRAPCCDKANVKKGPWSPEEDAKLKAYIEEHGTGGNWIALPQKIGLKRCGKSCRLRWLNYLRPNIKHGGFSEEEDNIICSLYVSIGSRWSIIAAQLPGRTDNDIKNYWNTRLKKKLLGEQRKEQQAQAQAQAQARRVSNLKQDQMKRETDNLQVVPNNGVITQTSPYNWPAQHSISMPMPAVPPNIASFQDSDLNSQSSSLINNLLTKYTNSTVDTATMNLQHAGDISFQQDQLYHPTTLINMMIDPAVAVVSTAVANNSSSTCDRTSNIFQGFNENLPNDFTFSELVSCVNQNQNQQQHIDGGSMQMQSFYGMDQSMEMASGSTNTTSTDQSTSTWGDMNMSSVVYSTLVSDHFQGCRQGIMPQDAAFEESSYFGMQLQ